MTLKILAAGAVLAFFAFATQAPANAACTAITTAAQLQAMSNNLAGNYCLKNDIDLGSIANFTPVGIEPNRFTGTFDGGGHVIRNFKTDHSDLDQVGLFGIAQNATLKNVAFENVAVIDQKNSTTVGALVGTALGATSISNVKILSGAVAFHALGGTVGGLAGFVTEDATVEQSSSAAGVGASSNANAGGLIGTIDTNATLRTSYATGTVFCAGASCIGGGLVGQAAGVGLSISKSFATGNVVCSDFCGGLAGDANGHFSYLYASGTVLGSSGATEGGLFGRLSSPSNTIVDQAFSVGLVGGSGSTLGGMVGVTDGIPMVTNSYWDEDTSGMSGSAAGNSLTTTQFQKTMPDGFDTSIWGITLKYSYPYLKAAKPSFNPQLATDVLDTAIFAFLPISELDKSNYTKTTNHIDEASLAACYTMIARAIGTTIDSNLADVTIDRYFWNDKTQKSAWKGPVTENATLGDFKPISGGTSFKNNVVAKMKKKNLVLLHGTYQDGNKTAESWMLGTLFSAEADGPPLAVFANDPFTGAQVQIDSDTKMVVSPKKFPLKNFKVDGYQPVTIGIVP